MKRLYWVSWFSAEKDHRPIQDPPTEEIIGWWCSGYDSSDRAILLAWIISKSDDQLEEIIKKNWPEFTQSDFRFFGKRKDKIDTIFGRFPLSKGWNLGRAMPWLSKKALDEVARLNKFEMLKLSGTKATMIITDEIEARHEYQSVTLSDGKILTYYSGGDISIQHSEGIEFELGNVAKGEIKELIDQLTVLSNLLVK